jgi:hypothetical protein
MSLCGLDFAFGPSKEIVVVGDLTNQKTVTLIDKINELFIPNSVVLLKTGKEKFLPVYALNLIKIENKPTAYVCSNFECNLPTSDPVELSRQLKK